MDSEALKNLQRKKAPAFSNMKPSSFPDQCFKREIRGIKHNQDRLHQGCSDFQPLGQHNVKIQKEGLNGRSLRGDLSLHEQSMRRNERERYLI